MPSQILQTLTTEVANATSVMASASALIRGIAGRIQAAVDAALANGATAAELAPVQAEADALKASSADLSAAVIANTVASEEPPVDPPVDPPPPDGPQSASRGKH